MILGEIAGSTLYHLVVSLATLILPLSTVNHGDFLRQIFLTRILYVIVSLIIVLGHQHRDNLFDRNAALVYVAFHLAMGVNAFVGVYVTKEKSD